MFHEAESLEIEMFFTIKPYLKRQSPNIIKKKKLNIQVFEF